MWIHPLEQIVIHVVETQNYSMRELNNSFFYKNLKTKNNYKFENIPQNC